MGKKEMKTGKSWEKALGRKGGGGFLEGGSWKKNISKDSKKTKGVIKRER